MFKTLIDFIRTERVWWRLRTQWKRAGVVADSARRAHKGNRVLMIPCDPWGVVGSRGDQAMILACLQHVHSNHPGVGVDVMTDSHATDDACRALGLNPIADWNVPIDRWFVAHAGDYQEVFIPGADVTDGVYGWPTALKMLAYYDLFTRAGVRVHYLGFSWSLTPNPMMKRVLARLSKNLPLLVRDPVSYKRLEAFTDHRPLVQVADAAFCLEPRDSARVRLHRLWVEALHAAGKKVIVVNVHTMFNDVETKSEDWERAFAAALKKLQCTHPDVQLLLLPHDNRPKVSDHAILKRLQGRFDPARAYLVDEVMNADEIKALLGSCDGLIAGRMHISIAALGQGVPVFGLVYQGKFEGLWQHFGLCSETLLEPRVFLTNPELAESRLKVFVANLGQIRNQIQVELPAVKNLARRNFQ